MLSFENRFSHKNFEKSRRFSSSSEYSPLPLQKLLQDIGNPQYEYKTIHLVGSVAKGSIATYLARMLNSQGFNAGLYTSPHFENITERISINEISITQEDIEHSYSLIEKYLSQHNISWFDCLTAIAFLYFKNRVQWAVVEAGLGGLKDSTNNLKPEFIVFTKIVLDHTKILGTTLTAIAQQKFGVVKEGSVVYSMPQEPEVHALLKQIISKKNAQLTIFEPEVSANYCEENLSFAYQLMQCHFKKSFTISQNLKGRLEVLSENPLVIFDAAHNEYAATKLADYITSSLDNTDSPWVIIINCMKERELEKLISPVRTALKASLKAIYLLPLEKENFYSKEDINKSLLHELNIVENQQDMVALLKRDIRMNFLVFGTIYLYAPIRKALKSLASNADTRIDE